MVGRNNPFNIRYVQSNQWLGQVGQSKGFIDFSYIEFGVRAAALLVMRTYRKKDVLTISEVINRFAPSSENNTKEYIDFVCSQLGVFPFDIPSSTEEYYKLLNAMSIFEGNPICIDCIKYICEHYNIKPFKIKLKKK